VVLFEVSEVWVAGDDVVGDGLHGAGEEHIIRGDVCYLLETIAPCSDFAILNKHTDRLMDIPF